MSENTDGKPVEWSANVEVAVFQNKYDEALRKNTEQGDSITLDDTDYEHFEYLADKILSRFFNENPVDEPADYVSFCNGMTGVVLVQNGKLYNKPVQEVHKYYRLNPKKSENIWKYWNKEEVQI